MEKHKLEKIFYIKDMDYYDGYFDEDLSFYLETDCPIETLQELANIAKLYSDDEASIQELVVDHPVYSKKEGDIRDLLKNGAGPFERLFEILEMFGYTGTNVSIEPDGTIEF